MKDKLEKLIDVKSIMTLVFTFVFAFLSAVKVITPEQFLDVFKLIVIFYFGTQSVKKVD